MADIKFSQFTDGDEARVGDENVGLRSGVNTRFDFPGAGVKDSNGNYLFQWATSGAAAVNYPKVVNSLTTASVTYTAGGTDSNISVAVTPLGTGAVILDGLTWPTADGTNGQILYTNGAGILDWTDAAFPVTPGAAGTFLRSDGTNWGASTATLANTYAINTILYASTANGVTGLATANSAILRTDATGVPGWSATMTDGQLLIGDTSGTPVAANITAGTNVTVTNGAGTITISSTGGTGGGYAWTNVTSTSASMASNGGYISNNAGLVTLTLPAVSAIGDALGIVGNGAGGWLLAQGAGQIVHIGSGASSTGAGGSVASTNRYDSLELVCTVANLEWVTFSAPQTSGLTVV